MHLRPSQTSLTMHQGKLFPEIPAFRDTLDYSTVNPSDQIQQPLHSVVYSLHCRCKSVSGVVDWLAGRLSAGPIAASEARDVGTPQAAAPRIVMSIIGCSVQGSQPVLLPLTVQPLCLANASLLLLLLLYLLHYNIWFW